MTVVNNVPPRDVEAARRILAVLAVALDSAGVARDTPARAPDRATERDEAPRRLYSLDGAARQLSVGKGKVEELVAADEIETVKIGRRRLVPSEALDDYVKRLRR